jgi:hypothetical protein
MKPKVRQVQDLAEWEWNGDQERQWQRDRQGYVEHTTLCERAEAHSQKLYIGIGFCMKVWKEQGTLWSYLCI